MDRLKSVRISTLIILLTLVHYNDVIFSWEEIRCTLYEVSNVLKSVVQSKLQGQQ